MANEESLDSRDQWLGAVAAGLLWFGVLEFAGRVPVGMVAAFGTREATAARRSYGSLPRWTFGVVWTLLYGLNSAGTFLYWRDAAESSRYYVVLGIVLANVFVNKLWSALFADARAYAAALGDLAANLVLAIVLVVLLGLDHALTQWWPFALFLPYVVWLVIALVLNWRFVNAYGRTLAPPAASTLPSRK